MSEKRTNVNSGYLKSKTTTWSQKSHTVYGMMEITASFDVEDVMDIIVENWEEFDLPVREAFSRKVAALRMKDAMKELEGGEKDKEDDGFKW